MRVVIKPASPMEVKHVELKEDGMTVKPLFFQPKGKANVGIIEVKREDGTVVFVGVLSVSGRDGSVMVLPRTTPVAAALDTENKGKKPS